MIWRPLYTKLALSALALLVAGALYLLWPYIRVVL